MFQSVAHEYFKNWLNKIISIQYHRFLMAFIAYDFTPKPFYINSFTAQDKLLD